MSDLISRSALMEYLEKVTVTEGITFETGFKQILTDIKNQPTVEAKPVVHGEWIDKGWGGDFSWHIDGRGHCWKVEECFICGYKLCGSAKTNFCPNCGADMRGGKND